MSLIPEGRHEAQFLGFMVHPVRPLSKGGPVSSDHPSLERARGKTREAVVNGGMPDARYTMAAQRGTHAVTAGGLRLGEERDFPTVTQGVSVFEPRPFLLHWTPYFLSPTRRDLGINAGGNRCQGLGHGTPGECCLVV